MKIHQVDFEMVLDFIRKNPGCPHQRINLHFGKVCMSSTLKKLEESGLIENRIECKGMNRNWMVKCCYPK